MVTICQADDPIASTKRRVASCMTSGHIRFGETNSSLQDPEVPPQAQRMNGPGLKNHRRINMRFVITGAASGIGSSCADLLAAGEAIRSAERRGGNEGGGTCRYRWSPNH